jgi:hypothetical protein
VLEIGFGIGKNLVSIARAVGATGGVCGLALSERNGGRLAVVAMAKGRQGALAPASEWAYAHLPKCADCRPIVARAFLQPAGLELFTVAEKSM